MQQSAHFPLTLGSILLAPVPFATFWLHIGLLFLPFYSVVLWFVWGFILFYSVQHVECIQQSPGWPCWIVSWVPFFSFHSTILLVNWIRVLLPWFVALFGRSIWLMPPTSACNHDFSFYPDGFWNGFGNGWLASFLFWFLLWQYPPYPNGLLLPFRVIGFLFHFSMHGWICIFWLVHVPFWGDTLSFISFATSCGWPVNFPPF